MKIINLFTGYFLFLMIFNGTILMVLDAESFKEENMIKVYKNARYIGMSVIVIGIALYILNFIYMKFI